MLGAVLSSGSPRECCAENSAWRHYPSTFREHAGRHVDLDPHSGDHVAGPVGATSGGDRARARRGQSTPAPDGQRASAQRRASWRSSEEGCGQREGAHRNTLPLSARGSPISASHTPHLRATAPGIFEGAPRANGKRAAPLGKAPRAEKCTPRCTTPQRLQREPPGHHATY